MVASYVELSNLRLMHHRQFQTMNRSQSVPDTVRGCWIVYIPASHISGVLIDSFFMHDKTNGEHNSYDAAPIMVWPAKCSSLSK